MCNSESPAITPEELVDLGLLADVAVELARQVNSERDGVVPEVRWRRISHEVLRADHGFDVHRFIHEKVFAGWDESRGPRPMWTPTEAIVRGSNVDALRQRRGLVSYAELYQWSIARRDEFWGEAVRALGIRFERPPTRVRAADADPRSAAWLPGATMNIAESCFQAASDCPAIVYSDFAAGLKRVSYGELRARADRVAGGLAALGLGPGDPVAIVMPMTVESVAMYLGILLAGGVVVSIADSFSAPEIATRLRIAGAQLAFTTESIVRGEKRLPLYTRLIEADAPTMVVIQDDYADRAALRPGDLAWSDLLDRNAPLRLAHVSPDATINVLFSSGTTGEPKAIPWDHVTPIKAAADGYFHHDIHPGDVLAWPTNLGWMMGPWLIFATLVNRGTMALYWDSPLDRRFGEFIQDARVNMLGVIPSIVRHWRNTACMEGLDWSAIRMFSSTGECSSPQDMLYLSHLAGYKPIIEYCGGTEIGGGYVTSTVVQPNAPATFSTAALGSEFVVLDDEGAPAPSGEVFLVPPAMGLSYRLLNRDHNEAYFDGTPPGPDGQTLRRHGDQIERLPGGYFRMLGRTDDTMNLGGIKVSPAEIERVLAGVDGVDEAVAIAVAPPGGGPSQLVVFAVPTERSSVSADPLRFAMQQAVNWQLNPLFRIGEVRLVDRLPRTASNKVMRRQLRAEYKPV